MPSDRVMVSADGKMHGAEVYAPGEKERALWSNRRERRAYERSMKGKCDARRIIEAQDAGR